VEVPARITEDAYRRLREIYDAMPLTHPDRVRYRDALLGHLVPLAIRYLERGKDTTALEEFEECLSLFEPTEVHRGGIHAPGLADLAGRFIKRYSPRGDAKKVMLGLAVQLSLGGDAAETIRNFRGHANWVNENEAMKRGRTLAGRDLIRAHEHCANHWPSSFVIEELKGKLMRAGVVHQLTGMLMIILCATVI